MSNLLVARVIIYQCTLIQLRLASWHTVSTVRVQAGPKDRGESYSLACGKLIPVKEVDRVSVYISQPVPCR